MRNAEIRIKKYEKKFNSDIVQHRFYYLKDLSVEQFRDWTTLIETLEKEVNNLLCENDVPITQFNAYYSFLREIAGQVKKGISQNSLKLYVNAIIEKYKILGLDEQILKKICKLLGIDL